ncbi:MAG: rRNA maturation RNase YbeY [Bryobacteraceae bacterium]
MSSSGDHIVLFRRAPAELNRCKLEGFARTLRGEVASGAGFTCLITGDSELRRLNRDFLGKDYPTDVLSFPAGQGPRPVHLGEIAISVARARAQAAALGHSIEDEIRILMLHGLLHLRGMDHETDQGQMQRSESRWRKRLALPAGLIERAKRVRVEAPAPSPQPPAPERHARPKARP